MTNELPTWLHAILIVAVLAMFVVALSATTFILLRKIVPLLLLALLPATCGATNPVELTVSESVSSVEVNSFHSDQTAQLVFVQSVWRDWYWQCECSHVIAWRLVGKCPRPTRVWPSGDYETVWLDGDVMRRVRARTLDETVTLHDPELCERESLPQESRRGLRVR